MPHSPVYWNRESGRQGVFFGRMLVRAPAASLPTVHRCIPKRFHRPVPFPRPIMWRRVNRVASFFHHESITLHLLPPFWFDSVRDSKSYVRNSLLLIDAATGLRAGAEISRWTSRGTIMLYESFVLARVLPPSLLAFLCRAAPTKEVVEVRAPMPTSITAVVQHCIL